MDLIGLQLGTRNLWNLAGEAARQIPRMAELQDEGSPASWELKRKADVNLSSIVVRTGVAGTGRKLHQHDAASACCLPFQYPPVGVLGCLPPVCGLELPKGSGYPLSSDPQTLLLHHFLCSFRPQSPTSELWVLTLLETVQEAAASLGGAEPPMVLLIPSPSPPHTYTAGARGSQQPNTPMRGYEQRAKGSCLHAMSLSLAELAKKYLQLLRTSALQHYGSRIPGSGQPHAFHQAYVPPILHQDTAPLGRAIMGNPRVEYGTDVSISSTPGLTRARG
ncbi:hypothetical protein P7K49_036200 [Saguinus oedipus]|uniref:Uncharacterized protein n=1 Tax=Saguinus oedipus TaxID=9490 RepID=A0ABQ9TK19_SAGOE|nr:hypothetical protein P7K49_036200 [Saguinus oedipus]